MGMTIEEEIYRMAFEYMAKTELYDRSLTNCRSPWDKTEAFLDNPRVKRLSNEYAAQLRRYYSKICGGTWQFIHNEIHKHTEYSAQMWINEYYRLSEKVENGKDYQEKHAEWLDYKKKISSILNDKPLETIKYCPMVEVHVMEEEWRKIQKEARNDD